MSTAMSRDRQTAEEGVVAAAKGEMEISERVWERHPNLSEKA